MYSKAEAYGGGAIKERQKKKKKERERKRGKKEGKKGKKKGRIGRHSSMSRGAPEGLQGRKLQGRQIGGERGEGAILIQLSTGRKKIMIHAPVKLADCF